MPRRQKRSLDEQALPSMQVQVPDEQVPQGEVVQVVGIAPLLPPMLPPLRPPEAPPMVPPEPVPHWQVVMSQVVPVAQMPPQFAGQVQLLLAPQVAGGGQEGLQVSATQALFTQDRPEAQPLGPQFEPLSVEETQTPVVVSQV